MGPHGTPQHATMAGVVVMSIAAVYGLVNEQWGAAALFGALALLGFLWARWLRNHPD